MRSDELEARVMVLELMQAVIEAAIDPNLLFKMRAQLRLAVAWDGQLRAGQSESLTKEVKKLIDGRMARVEALIRGEPVEMNRLLH